MQGFVAIASMSAANMTQHVILERRQGLCMTVCHRDSGDDAINNDRSIEVDSRRSAHNPSGLRVVSSGNKMIRVTRNFVLVHRGYNHEANCSALVLVQH